jgi:hypothetical protein
MRGSERENSALIQLALLASAFVVVEAILFAFVSVTSQSLMAYPIVVTLWVAFLWIFSGRAMRMLSASPHAPRRAIVIILLASGISIAALVLGIAIGVLFVG